MDVPPIYESVRSPKYPGLKKSTTSVCDPHPWKRRSKKDMIFRD